jgi:DNA-binding transcriptional LysR family regulator
MVMNEWRFEHDGKQSALRFTPAMVCDDGALLRQWVLADAGIASKSWWDVKRDVEQAGCNCCLRKVLLGLAALIKNVGLQFVYPQRRLQPLPVTAFTQFFIDWLENE